MRAARGAGRAEPALPAAVPALQCCPARHKPGKASIKHREQLCKKALWGHFWYAHLSAFGNLSCYIFINEFMPPYHLQSQDSMHLSAPHIMESKTANTFRSDLPCSA